MRYKLTKLMLYSGVIALAVICLFAIIDNYELAIVQGLSASYSCYEHEVFDNVNNQVKTVRTCDSYNPQLIFYGSIILLIFDGLVLHYFSKTINVERERQTQNFVNELRRHEREQRNNNTSKEVS